MRLMTRTEKGTINGQRDKRGIWLGIYKRFNICSLDFIDGKFVLTIDEKGVKEHEVEIIYGKVK